MTYRQQLSAIQKASGWSQEQLAARLGVSFATLNSWINGRSEPRPKGRQNIDRLYLEIVGTEQVDGLVLERTKRRAARLTTNVQTLVTDQASLDALTLHLTYHTNTIEGSTMTLSDVQEVLFEQKVLTNRTAVEQLEARNHQATLYWLLDELTAKGRKFVIDETCILGIHLRLMNGIISDAGQYRRHSVRIMGSKVPVANWVKIPSRMRQFVRQLQKPAGDVVGQLAWTHAQFEQIHPFSDGNGRTGRLIMLAQALQASLLPPVVAKERRYAYYKYLELAQMQQDYQPLELFIAQSMQFTEDLLRQAE